MERKAYIKPELTVVTFRSENGFQASNNPNLSATIWLSTLIGGGNSYQDMESFSNHDTWNQNDGNAFWE